MRVNSVSTAHSSSAELRFSYLPGPGNPARARIVAFAPKPAPQHRGFGAEKDGTY